jgi:hypothetical protein
VRVGCYPGSFDPPTVAHLAVAEAARAAHRLDRVELVVSRVPLGKRVVVRPTLDDRVAVLERLAARVGWLGVVVSDRRLIADLAEGYDVVIMGADKWAQVQDPAFYDGSHAARDAAVARLPELALAPRGTDDAGHLDVDPDLRHVSSTAARAGARELMVPEAREIDERPGAWTDTARYDDDRVTGR